MKPLSVSELSELIRFSLHTQFPTAISIEGEISNFSASQNGHWYFTLKDETSQIATVMFKRNNTATSFLPKNGMQVQVTGSVSFYQERGQCQIICSYIQQQGIGTILTLLEKRKKKLQSEGLFSNEHKQEIPLFPRRVGILTSSTGAALQDIYKTFTSYSISPHITLFHTAVQGDNAVQDIIQQLHNASQQSDIFDVLIITRGGGSSEDLLAYSDEQVVRTIYECPLPIIAAIGHEIDTSLCDLVADYSVATPTASAAFIAEKMLACKQNVSNKKKYISHFALQKLEEIKLIIQSSNPSNTLREFSLRIANMKQHIDFISEKNHRNLKQILERIKHNIVRVKDYFSRTSPTSILKKGYTLTYKHNKDTDTHTLVTHAETLQAQDLVRISFYDGNKHAIITEKKE